MFTAAFYGSWFAYVAITFALGFVWHLVVFKNLYHRLAIYTRLDDPIIPLGLLSMLIQGAVLAYLYPEVVDVHGGGLCQTPVTAPAGKRRPAHGAPARPRRRCPWA